MRSLILTVPLVLSACIIKTEECPDDETTTTDTGTETDTDTDTGTDDTGTPTDTDTFTEPDCTKVFDMASVTEDLTLTAECVIEVPGYVVVEQGVVLTIEPGTVLAFGPTAGLGIEGRLVADGTAGAPIRFTARDTQQPGAWTGVHFGHYPNRDNILRHAIMEYGGASHSAYEEAGTFSIAWAADMEPGTFVLEDSTFRHNLYGGVGVWSMSGNTPVAGMFTSFARNTFEDNGGLSVRLPVQTIADIAADNVMDEPVHVASHYYKVGSATWPALGVPYLFEAGLQLAEPESELHLEGLDLLFARGTDLEVTKGSLFADGVRFASAASTPMPGDWEGLFVGFQASGHFTDCIIEHVGSGDYETLGFQNDSALYSTITDTTFRNNAGAANIGAVDHCARFQGMGNTYDLEPCVW